MILLARIPETRRTVGTLWVADELDTQGMLHGDWQCYGKADSGTARRSGNAARDPTKSNGDHPFGWYRIGDPRKPDPARSRSYGPWFIPLTPIAGQAWTAAHNGRIGLGIHGGALDDGDVDQDGITDELRATNGCLRLTNAALEELVGLIERLPIELYFCGGGG